MLCTAHSALPCAFLLCRLHLKQSFYAKLFLVITGELRAALTQCSALKGVELSHTCLQACVRS